MANTTIKTRILLRNDTLANWGTSTLTLGKGEIAIATLNEGLAEVRVGTGSSTWANSLRLNISADQVSGLTEMISSLVGDGAKKYQVISTDTNSWKLQEAALSGGDWSDVAGSTWTVDFTAINNAITGLTADVSFLSGAIDAVSGVVNTICSDYLKSADKTELTGADAYISGQVDSLSTTLNTVSSDYVKATDFAALSNEIGLSAASGANHVATMDDIKDIAGAMHFRGAVTPNEGETDLEALARAITDPASGDVAIITTTSKEYVYDGTNWIELGDEILYATKAEVAGISAELTGDIAGLTANVDYLSDQIDATNATLNTVSSDYLKAADKTELTTLVGTVSAETLVSANAYTDNKFAGLSDYYTKTEVDAISTALSTDYVGKIKEVDDKLSDYALKTEAAEMSAYAYGEASAYTDSEIAKLSIDRFALSADVDTLVSQTSAAIVGDSSDTSADNTIYGAKAYADDKVNELSSGFLILDCGASTLRTDEPDFSA